MRVIYLHQYFNTPEMSGSTRSYEIARRLVATGHRVDLITTWREPTDRRGWFTTDAAGITVHWLPIAYSNAMSYRARVGAFTEFALRAAMRASRIDGDVVFATSTPLTIAIPAVLASKRRRIPMVFEVRDLWPELPIAVGALRNPVLRVLARRLERFAYAHSDAIIALSPGMAEGVRRTGYAADKVTVVPNACDLQHFARDEARGRDFRRNLGIADEQILVGYVGTLGFINGVSYLARLALALKDDSRFVFLTVGDGQERVRIESLARSSGILGHNFRMISGVAKNDVPAVFSALDVATSLFLPIPEMEANSANKFFDALASGCCVAINYGGWQETLLRTSGAGIRLSADPSRAAAELQAAAVDPAQRRRAGLCARALAETEFGRDALVEKVRRVLTDVVDATG